MLAYKVLFISCILLTSFSSTVAFGLYSRVIPRLFVSSGRKCLNLRYHAHPSQIHSNEEVVQAFEYNKINTLLDKSSVYLIGMMGSGKSTIAEELSKRIGYRCMDTDTIAEQASNMLIAQYLEKRSESGFRDLETVVLNQMTKLQSAMVATGGGIVVKQENWPLLQHGVVVFLDISPVDVYERFVNNHAAVQKRPLLMDNPLKSLTLIHAKRIDMYRRADITVPIKADDSFEDIITAVLNALVQFVQQNSTRWQQLSSRAEAFSTSVENPAVQASEQSTPIAMEYPAV